MLHGMHYLQSGCFGPCCIKSTAFNRDALGHAPWNQLHSIMLDGIHCIQPGCILPCCMECTAVNHAAWNSLHSIGIQCAKMHGIHCVQSKSIAPHCMGSITPTCMEYTGFNRDAFYHAASNPLHSVMPHGTTAFNWDTLGLTA